MPQQTVREALRDAMTEEVAEDLLSACKCAVYQGDSRSIGEY